MLVATWRRHGGAAARIICLKNARSCSALYASCAVRLDTLSPAVEGVQDLQGVRGKQSELARPRCLTTDLFKRDQDKDLHGASCTIP